MFFRNYIVCGLDLWLTTALHAMTTCMLVIVSNWKGCSEEQHWLALVLIVRSDTDKLLFDVGWPLADRWRSFRLHLLYIIINNLAPAYLTDDFVIYTQRRVSLHNFRSSGKLSIPFCKKKTKYASSFFSKYTMKLWNDLPKKIVDCQSLAAFKNCFVSQFKLNSLSHLYNSLDGYFEQLSPAKAWIEWSERSFIQFQLDLTDNPICSLCLDQFESVFHFLFSCLELNVLRECYLSELGLIIPNNIMDSIEKACLINICLFGMNGAKLDVNKRILLSTMNYIKLLSERFSREYLSFKN